MKKIRLSVLIFPVIVGLLWTGCGGGGDGSSPNINPNPSPIDDSLSNVKISWTANRETAVNSPGGGYRVYYASTPGFSPTEGTVINVPYTSAPLSPTSTVISLSSGTYYFRVVAYSSLNSNGSEPSQEESITVP